MRKKPNYKWIDSHTIATAGGDSGILAIVDQFEAGIVTFEFDLSFGICVDETQRPLPEQLFEIPEYCNPFDYITREEYLKHPAVANFVPEIAWIWEGTSKELFNAAKDKTDLMFPDRKISEEDSDYVLMSELYSEIRKYLQKRAKRKENKKHKPEIGGMCDIFEND